MTVIDRGEYPASMEPLLLAEDSRHRPALSDPALELAVRASGFRSSLPAGVMVALAHWLSVLDTGGVWSIARGPARKVDTYKQLPANCDLQRRNDLDGRGNLSEEALVEFTRFFSGNRAGSGKVHGRPDAPRCSAHTDIDLGRGENPDG